jgi:hypothetical protein
MKYRVSSNSPLAICKHRKNSLVVPRPKPSAMLAAIDEVERLACDNPELIALRDLLRQPKQQQRQLMRLLPNLQLTVPPDLHQSPIS